MSNDLPVICGAIKLLPVAFAPWLGPVPPGITQVALTCVREPGTPNATPTPPCTSAASTPGPSDPTTTPGAPPQPYPDDVGGNTR
jgi:hypothetical protein